MEGTGRSAIKVRRFISSTCRAPEGTTVGTTTLSLSDAVSRFMLLGSRVVAAEYSKRRGASIQVSRGGAALTTITHLHLPQGVAISLAR